MTIKQWWNDRKEQKRKRKFEKEKMKTHRRSLGRICGIKIYIHYYEDYWKGPILTGKFEAESGTEYTISKQAKDVYFCELIDSSGDKIASFDIVLYKGEMSGLSECWFNVRTENITINKNDPLFNDCEVKNHHVDNGSELKIIGPPELHFDVVDELQPDGTFRKVHRMTEKSININNEYGKYLQHAVYYRI